MKDPPVVLEVISHFGDLHVRQHDDDRVWAGPRFTLYGDRFVPGGERTVPRAVVLPRERHFRTGRQFAEGLAFFRQGIGCRSLIGRLFGDAGVATGAAEAFESLVAVAFGGVDLNSSKRLQWTYEHKSFVRLRRSKITWATGPLQNALEVEKASFSDFRVATTLVDPETLWLQTYVTKHFPRDLFDLVHRRSIVMADFPEEIAQHLFGKWGARLLALVTGGLVIAWILTEGFQHLDSMVFRWIVCALIIAVCSRLLVSTAITVTAPSTSSTSSPAPSAISISKKVTFVGIIAANSLYLVWSIGVFCLEPMLELRYENSASGTRAFHPVAGADSDFWDVIALTDEFTLGNRFSNKSMLSFRIMKAHSVDYVDIRSVIVTLERIEDLPKLKMAPLEFGIAVHDVEYYFNLPESVDNGSIEISPAFFAYKDAFKPWSDNTIRLDDGLPLNIKLFFAAKKPGIYVISDIKIKASRKLDLARDYSLVKAGRHINDGIPTRLAFVDTEDKNIVENNIPFAPKRIQAERIKAPAPEKK